MNECILLAIASILFIIFLKVRFSFEKDKQFRKNIKEGDKARFYVDNEKYYGRVTKVHHPFVDFDFYNETYTDYISNIFPA
jgi:hypothetical protein